MRKRIWEAGSCLHRWKADLANVGVKTEAKDGLPGANRHKPAHAENMLLSICAATVLLQHLHWVVSEKNVPLYLNDVPVEPPSHVIKVTEYECLGGIKIACYDVLDIFLPQSIYLICCQIHSAVHSSTSQDWASWHAY